jgi:hypothetical protein
MTTSIKENLKGILTMADLTPTHETPLSPAVQSKLGNLKSHIATLAAPTRVEENLMRAFTAHAASSVANPASQSNERPSIGHTPRGRTPRGFFSQLTHWLAPGAALAASVGMALWVAVGTVTMPEAGLTANVSFTNSDAPFIALQSLDRIALEPSPRLIETIVPKMLLASYGVAISPETAGDQIHAQMLVSAAGQPLALRFAP